MKNKMNPGDMYKAFKKKQATPKKKRTKKKVNLTRSSYVPLEPKTRTGPGSKTYTGVANAVGNDNKIIKPVKFRKKRLGKMPQLIQGNSPAKYKKNKKK